MSRADLQDRASDLRTRRIPYVHARVVLAQRPTSAKPGDEAIIFADGSMEGFVGGSCAESTVRAQSLTLLATRAPLLLRITPTEEEQLAHSNHHQQDGSLTVHNPCLSGGTLEIFLEPMIPAPLVVVAGDTPIARALLELAGPLGHAGRSFDGTLPGDTAAVVVASHGRDEEQVLTDALRSDVPYVGLVASRKRGEAVLGAIDVCASMKARVHTPAGLDIGARTPEEVALSILAEIISTRPRQSGRPVGEGTPTSAESAIDPVCGMSVVMIDASLHLDHEAHRYWFCGSGCLRAFAADPSAYLS
jgi:xanthine dehydrogenase accessory factor